MDEALANPDQSQFINGEVFEKFRGFGGIRLEDVLVVRPLLTEVFVLLPRTVRDVEQLMASSKNQKPVV
jgi:Xaa-Pro dipeptidase